LGKEIKSSRDDKTARETDFKMGSPESFMGSNYFSIEHFKNLHLFRLALDLGGRELFDF